MLDMQSKQIFALIGVVTKILSVMNALTVKCLSGEEISIVMNRATFLLCFAPSQL